MTDTPAICRTCRWWHTPNGIVGECRRYPPPTHSTNSAFWCGEHEAEPAAEDAD